MFMYIFGKYKERLIRDKTNRDSFLLYILMLLLFFLYIKLLYFIF